MSASKLHISPYVFAAMGKRSLSEVEADTIVKLVAQSYELLFDDLFKKTRANPIREARQVACYFLFKKGLAKERIAKYFSQDHTTVINSIQVVKRDIESFPAFAARIESIKSLSEYGMRMGDFVNCK